MILGTVFGAAVLQVSVAAAALGPLPPPPPQPESSAAAQVAPTSGNALPAPVAPTPVAMQAVAPPAAALPENALDFTSYARTLAHVAACSPVGALPERFDPRVIESHCTQLAALQERWRQLWLTQAQPFLARVVPHDLPPTVVYPFGGGDLLTALVTFPRATEITTLSLEPAGDPRSIDALTALDLEPMLAEVREKVNHLFHYGHSKTIDMGKMAKSKLPGDLTYALVALEMNQLDPVAVRFFRIDRNGTLLYLTQADLDPTGEPRARRAAFANMEIEYMPRGGGPRRIFRHIAANLDDPHLKADPGVLRHLEAKGQVAAITKAASYLLWWKEFGQIRNYLLRNMVWMISDSTGIPTDDAVANGFEQIPYGRFDGPFLGGGIRPTEVFRKLWAEKAQPLAFRFGYPDASNHDHLLITRRVAKQ